MAIFFQEFLFVQVLCLLIFSTIALTYLVEVKPFAEPRMQRLEIFNEICTLFLTYNMLCFSEDANLQLVDSVHYYDSIFVGGILLNLAVHVFFLLKDSFMNIADNLKAKCCKKESSEAQYEEKKEGETV